MKHDAGKDTVQRIWKARTLKPWSVDTVKLSKDPDFDSKLVDVDETHQVTRARRQSIF